MILWLKRVQRALIIMVLMLPWYALFINLILIDIRRVNEYGYGMLLGFVLQLYLTYLSWTPHAPKQPLSKSFLSFLLVVIVVGSFLVHYLPLILL